MSARRHFILMLTTIGKRGGDDEGTAGHGKRDKQTGPLVAVLETVIDAWGVERNHKEEEHQAEGGGSEAAEDFQGDAGTGGDEACTREINPGKVGGKPGGDERGEVGGVFKMLPAENDQREGKNETRGFAGDS